MRRGMAEALLAARRSARAVVLVTPLDGGAQRLLDAEALELLAQITGVLRGGKA